MVLSCCYFELSTLNTNKFRLATGYQIQCTKIFIEQAITLEVLYVCKISTLRILQNKTAYIYIYLCV